MKAWNGIFAGEPIELEGWERREVGKLVLRRD